MRHRFMKVMLGAALFMLLGAHGDGCREVRSANPVQDRLHLSRAPALSAPTAPKIQGFKLGLQYRPREANKVNGKTLDITYIDDKGDAATGGHRGEGPDRAGHQDPDGHRLVRRRGADRCRSPLRTRCCTSPARQPPMRSPASTSTRSAPGGRRSRTWPRRSYLGKAVGKKVVVFDQDTVFGHGNYAAVKAFFGDANQRDRGLVPFGDRLHAVRPARRQNESRLLFIAWAGTTAARCSRRSISRES